jgi:myo-inositol-1(or 4)-monophosphatase
MNPEKIINQANEIVLKVGTYISEQSRQIHSLKIEEKDVNSLVSIVEIQLAEGFKNITPGCGFLTEENTINVKGKEVEWIIDPLDGTTNFLYGVPAYAISVGLRVNEIIVGGIIYDVSRKELFYAVQQGGSFMNNRKIFVSKRKQLKTSLLATGFPYYDFSKTDNYLAVIKQLIKTTRGIRRIGSAAIDLAYVACGRFDGFFEYSLNPWDVAGGIIIISEAGGMVTDFSAGNNYLFGKEIIATNTLIHHELYTVIKENFP